jgi:SAM-dependent methyltransferase
MKKKSLSSDVYGQALYDYFQHGEADPLYLHTSYEVTEEMPVDWFFRDEEDFPALELRALKAAQGKILDIGAGVGSHAIELYEQGKEVHALDNSPYCVEIMKARGLPKVLHQSLWESFPEKYDTLLLLMNGIGIVGTLEGLRKFLCQAHDWIRPGGQILFDSSDLSYLYEDIKLEQYPYKGEIQYQYEYKGKKGEWFSWLYVDQHTMKNYAEEAGWKMELLEEDHNDQYLASLQRA